MGSDPGTVGDRRYQRPPSGFFTDDDDDEASLPQPTDHDRVSSRHKRGDTLRLSGPTSFPVMVPPHADTMATFRPPPPDGQTERINFMLPEDVA